MGRSDLSSCCGKKTRRDYSFTLNAESSLAATLFLDKTGVGVISFASNVDLHFCSHHPFPCAVAEMTILCCFIHFEICLYIIN